VYHRLGAHYIESGRFTKALQHFKQGSSALGGIFRRANDWLSLARTHVGIADALYERLRLRPADSQLSHDHERDYEQAVEAYTQALDTLAKGSGTCGAAAVRSSLLKGLTGTGTRAACNMACGMQHSSADMSHASCNAPVNAAWLECCSSVLRRGRVGSAAERQGGSERDVPGSGAASATLVGAGAHASTSISLCFRNARASTISPSRDAHARAHGRTNSCAGAMRSLRG
jgi:hypothetical protein